MTQEKKDQIIKKFVDWHNMRHEQGLAVPNPFRYGFFAMWVEYNSPDEKADVDELHDYLLETVRPEPAGEDSFDGCSFNPWID